MLSLTFYGGVNEIGGNKILLEEDIALFFDFGTSFARSYQYFEEYLKPRAGAGLLDLVEMGLLPPLLQTYRADLIPNNFWSRFQSSPLCREVNAQAVLLSHAHLDHSGYISLLREDIPIYATTMTAFIAKAMQDSGRTEFDKEVCYSIPREERDGVFEATPWQRVPARQRLFKVFDWHSLTPDALAWWQKAPGARKLQSQPLQRADRIGHLSVQYFPVDHSIFGASAFAVETSSGWLVYTGDLRLHGKRGHVTEGFINAAAHLKPLILLCEGTNVNSDVTVTEDEVYDKALEAVKKAKALVLADFGPRNVERLLIFRQVAQESDRSLVILARDAYLLQAMHYISPEIPDIASDRAICIYQDAKAQLNRWEKEIRDRYKVKLVTPEEIGAHQEDYILCFSFFDINELPSLMPQKGSVYIYSSSEPHNEEQEMDFWRLHNWLDHFDMVGIGLPVEQLNWEIPENERGLHASGHASSPELLELIQNIAPRILIPIHTEDPDYFAHNLKGIEVRQPQYGEEIRFS